MSRQVDEIRARSLICEGEMCASLRYLLALLDKRTEALTRIGKMNSCVDDCGIGLHLASRIAREALAEVE